MAGPAIIYPRANGGSNTANIVLAHHDCNHKKGGRNPTPDEVEKFHQITGTWPKTGGRTV